MKHRRENRTDDGGEEGGDGRPFGVALVRVEALVQLQRQRVVVRAHHLQNLPFPFQRFRHSPSRRCGRQHGGGRGRANMEEQGHRKTEIEDQSWQLRRRLAVALTRWRPSSTALYFIDGWSVSIQTVETDFSKFNRDFFLPNGLFLKFSDLLLRGRGDLLALHPELDLGLEVLADGADVDERGREADGRLAVLGVAGRVAQRHGVQVVEDVVHADDFVVEVVVALRRWQERVAERHEQVQQVHGLRGQCEHVELAHQRRVAAVQKLPVPKKIQISFGYFMLEHSSLQRSSIQLLSMLFHIIIMFLARLMIRPFDEHSNLEVGVPTYECKYQVVHHEPQ